MLSCISLRGHLYRRPVPDSSGKGVVFRHFFREEIPEENIKYRGYIFLCFSPEEIIKRGGNNVPEKLEKGYVKLRSRIQNPRAKIPPCTNPRRFP
jgi:hypothetical protein